MLNHARSKSARSVFVVPEGLLVMVKEKGVDRSLVGGTISAHGSSPFSADLTVSGFHVEVTVPVYIPLNLKFLITNL